MEVFDLHREHSQALELNKRTDFSSLKMVHSLNFVVFPEMWINLGMRMRRE